MRPRLPAIKPLLTAAGLLLAAAGGGELLLRLRNDTERNGDLLATGGLTEPSRTVHHRLRPLSSFESRDPDTGEAVALAINSHGLRGPEVAVPKPPGVFRVLCLGDETVLGPEVPEPQTFPARLQALLQSKTRLQVEVLNGGHPGDCPLLAWLRLRDSWLALQPDLIVLHLDMSDVADDQGYRRHTRLAPGDVPVACQHPAVTSRRRPKPWWADLRLTTWCAELAGGAMSGTAAGGEIDDPRAATAWLRDNPPDWGLYVEQALSPLEEIRRAADGTYASLVVATCPQPWQVSAEASDGPGVREAAGIARGVLLANRGPFEAVEAFAERHDLALCDASAAFRDDSDPARLYFTNSPRLSRYGCELYARVVSEFVGARLTVFGATERGQDPAEEPAEVHSAEPPVSVPAAPGPTALAPREIEDYPRYR